MSDYQLIAFDMDGTLLNGQKEISPACIHWIHQAALAGKTVILNTGRCPAELEEYFSLLPDLTYVNCVSGALVYNHATKETIYSRTLPVDIVKKLLSIASKEDVMLHLLSTQSVVQKDVIPRMKDYHMEIYRNMFARVTSPVDDLPTSYLAAPYPVPKLNLYHRDPEARLRTRKRILDLGLDVELADAETTSLEISARGIHKGIGLSRLCEYLHIPLSQTIVVGDADNDAAALQAAGLPVAMANAKDRIKALADVITMQDNDHDGCAEVIQKYLLS